MSRHTSRSVTFRRPFILAGFEEVQPAGTYIIDVEEEEIENISFLAYRRVSTQIQLPRLGATEHLVINPAELDEALMNDAEEKEAPGPKAAKPAMIRRTLAARSGKRR